MAPHSSTLAWRIPWMEEPGGLQSMGSLRVGHDWATSLTFHFHALEKEMATHSNILVWRIPGTEGSSGLLSMGSHRVGHNWSDLAAAAAAKEKTNKSCMSSSFSHVWLFANLGPVAFQAPLSMGLSRQEDWSGVPCPPPGDLPNPGREPTSLNVSWICRWVLQH